MFVLDFSKVWQQHQNFNSSQTVSIQRSGCAHCQGYILQSVHDGSAGRAASELCSCIQTCGICRHYLPVHNVVARPTLPGMFVKPSAAFVKRPAFRHIHFFPTQIGQPLLCKGTHYLNNDCLFVLLNPEVNQKEYSTWQYLILGILLNIHSF